MSSKSAKAKSPRDYVRCRGCDRLVEHRNAQKIDGAYFGRECAPKARQAFLEGDGIFK